MTPNLQDLVRLQGYQLIVCGDSMTERWRGTSRNRRLDGAEVYEESFRRHFGNHRTAVLAIAGTNIHRDEFHRGRLRLIKVR